MQNVSPRILQRGVRQVAAHKKLHEKGMRAEVLMSLEEMLGVAPKDTGKVDPSGELHKEEPMAGTPETNVLSHCWFATDDLSGANLGQSW